MSEPAYAIRLDGVAKTFAHAGRRLTLLQLLRSAGNRNRSRPHEALAGIDLAIPQGGVVGVIGRNGAGKTTLLKTIAGLYEPSAGTIDCRGEVTLVAGLGAGMVDELTVADNIWLYGAILRIRRSRLRAQFAAILEWAALEPHQGSELRTLSTGLRTRLAFAVGMQVQSEIVLMDEAFSAGDQRFQQQCDAFFAAVPPDRTFLVATHNLDFVRRFCAATLWLDEGRIRRFGSTAAIVDEFGAAGS